MISAFKDYFNWIKSINMPISEDEFEYSRSMQEPQTTMSKAELRKTHKPIMEKRRRARINHCLNEIKTLILEAMNKDVSTANDWMKSNLCANN